MFPLTLRETKGSPLTHQEMDNNLKHVMFPPFLHIQDQKPQGTHGGTFTAGAWQTRDLNTVLTNTITGASLAANQITLPAGTYYVEASAPGFYCRSHQTKLRRITETASDILIGSSMYVFEDSSNSARAMVVTLSKINGIINSSAEAGFELQHRCEQTRTSNGFGRAGDFTTEVYSDIRIWRIGEYEEE